MDKKTFCAHAIHVYQGKTDSLDVTIITSNEFIDFCQEQRILSRIEKKLLPYFTEDKSTDYFYSEIKACRIQALKQVAVINSIAKLFNEHQLTWLSFKGPVLSYVLFGDATLRTSKDIDIWVLQSDLNKAHELLVQNGFSLSLESEKNKCSLAHCFLRKDDTYHHQLTGVELELHWNLAYSSHFNNDLITNNSKRILFCQEGVSIFTSEMEFIYLCGHAGRSHWQRLSWLFDLYDYSEKIPMDKQKIIAIAKQHKLHYYLQHALEVLNYFFGSVAFPYPDSNAFIHKISQREIRLIVEVTSRNKKRAVSVILREILEEVIMANSIKNFIVRCCIILDSRIKRLKRM